MNYINLFASAFAQIFLIACSTMFISRGEYEKEFVVAFMIGWLWTVNVSKVAIGSNVDRAVYSFGSACGAIVGMWFTEQII